MGESGGRSTGNRTGAGAVRRSTQRQRSYIDPPPGEERTSEEELPVPGLSPSNVVIVAAVAVAAAALLIALGVAAIWAAAVLGIIS